MNVLGGFVVPMTDFNKLIEFMHHGRSWVFGAREIPRFQTSQKRFSTPSSLVGPRPYGNLTRGVRAAQTDGLRDRGAAVSATLERHWPQL